MNVGKLIASHEDTIQQFLKFAVVGGIGFVIDVCLFHLALDYLQFNRTESALFSFPYCVCFTWLGNRYYTFRGKSTGTWSAQAVRFLTVCLIGLVMNRGTFIILTHTIPFIYNHSIIGLMAGTGVGMFFNFFFSRRLVFR
jgi:hypothetical protein